MFCDGFGFVSSSHWGWFPWVGVCVGNCICSLCTVGGRLCSVLQSLFLQPIFYLLHSVGFIVVDIPTSHNVDELVKLHLLVDVLATQ